ncbi:MAG: hypothetical protein U9R14_02390 [Patescibacteria group bacterium]|nr:hypothetical protein [Patescibacteria group bacterium]
MVKKLLPTKIKNAKLVPWEKLASKSVFKLGKDSRAGVVLDKQGAPIIFIFDTNALLDVLSEIDEKLIDKLSDKEYASKSVNPAGWFIDEIESKLPLKQDFVASLRKSIDEAKKKGWIPFSKIQADLGL